MNIRIVITISILLFVSGLLTAQVFGDKFQLYHTLYDIKTSPVVVRMNMKTRTLNAYKKILENPQLDESEKERTQLQYNELKEERKNYKFVVMEAFSKEFTFSNTYFIENQHFSKFRRGQPGLLKTSEGVVVDRSPSHYYVLIQGENDLQWKLVDKNLEPLGDSLFEEGIGFKRVVNLLLQEVDSNLNDMEKVSKKLNDKLTRVLNTAPLNQIIPTYFFIPYRT